MKKSLTVGCVIMASGLSRRFGTNKLLADFCGQPMLCRAFDATATPGIAARIVVTRSENVQALCRAHGVPVLLHSLPGRNDTVRLGLSALLEQQPELSGCMFLPGDQPLLRRESVGSLVDFYREHPEHIAALGHDGVRGNPCLFPARLFPELLALQGDHGGNQVIRRHEEDLLLWEVPAPELTDVDTPQVLAQLRRDMAEE